MFDFIKVGTSTGVRLSEWKGSISLETGYQDKEGKVVLEWVLGKHYDKTAKTKVQDEKEKPLKIYLGNKERAVEVLQALIWQLRGKESSKPPAKSFPEEEIPF